MSKFITGTQAQCAAWKQALDTDAGCPIRGITYGGPDRVDPLVPGPGWTTTITEDVLVVNPGQAALEVPDDHLFRLGKKIGPTTLPAQASAVAIASLSPAVRALAYARQGKDASGNPLSFLDAEDKPTVHSQAGAQPK